MRRDGRAVYGSGLENRRGVTHRGFESLSLRHFFCLRQNLPEKLILAYHRQSAFITKDLRILARCV